MDSPAFSPAFQKWLRCLSIAAIAWLTQVVTCKGKRQAVAYRTGGFWAIVCRFLKLSKGRVRVADERMRGNMGRDLRIWKGNTSACGLSLYVFICRGINMLLLSSPSFLHDMTPANQPRCAQNGATWPTFVDLGPFSSRAYLTNLKRPKNLHRRRW
jgi:hypothetical protein